MAIALRLPDNASATDMATAIAALNLLLARLTASRAGLMDNLTRLDVNVSSVSGGGGTSSGAHIEIG